MGLWKPRSNSISNYHNEKKHLGPVRPGLHHVEGLALELQAAQLVCFLLTNPEDDYTPITDALGPSVNLGDL